MDSFTIETVIQSLANNKHNDSTTTYYLLHKKFLGQVTENKDKALQEHENQLVTLSQGNQQKIIFKL